MAGSCTQCSNNRFLGRSSLYTVVAEKNPEHENNRDVIRKEKVRCTALKVVVVIVWIENKERVVIVRVGKKMRVNMNEERIDEMVPRVVW